MPQGPPELHARFGDDSNAIQLLLSHNFTIDQQFIIRPPEGYIPTDEDNDAIDYLVLEWDYGYERKEQ